MELGNKLKNLRLSRELTQEELAEVFHLEKSSISRYESNQQVPGLDILKKIADFFDVSLDYLTNEETEKVEEINSTILNERLRELRISKKLNQKELSKELGIPSNTYNGYEIGRREPNFETLIKIAKYFNVTTDYLLGLEEDLKELKAKVTLEDEVKALKIVNDNLAIAEEVLNQVDISRKSYCAGRVDILKDVLQEIIDKL